MSLRRVSSCPPLGQRESPSQSWGRQPSALTREDIKDPLSTNAATLRQALDRAVHGAVDQNLREASSARAPGVGGELIAGAAGLRVTTYHWAIATHVTPQSAPTVQGDRFGLTMNFFADGAQRDATSVSLCADTLQLGFGHRDDGGMGRGTFLQVQPDAIMPGVSLSQVLTMGLTLGLSVGLKMRADSQVRLLAVQGGRVRVRQEAARSLEVQFTGGLGVSLTGFLPWMGIGGRWARRWGNQRRLDRWEEAASFLPRLYGRQSGALARTKEAAGLTSPITAWPGLYDAQHTDPYVAEALRLKVGDEFAMTSEAGARRGLALAVMGVLGGQYTTWQRSVQMTVRRLQGAHVVVGLTHQRVRATTHALEVPIVADWHTTVLQADAVHESYGFDLRFTEARQAYALILKGSVPGGALAWRGAMASPQALCDTLAAQRLPLGVQQRALTWVYRPHDTNCGHAVGMPWYVPRVVRFGRAQQTPETASTQVSYAKGQLQLMRTWEAARVTERYRQGTQTETVWVKRVSLLARLADPVFAPMEASYKMGLGFEFTRLGSGARSRMVGWLNENILNHPVADYPLAHGTGAYAVHIEREVAGLQVPVLPVPPHRHTGTALDAVSNVAADATFTQMVEFLRREGPTGVGALHRVSGGGDAALDVAINRLTAQSDEVAATALVSALQPEQTSLGGFTVEALGRALAHSHALARRLAGHARDARLDPLLQRFCPGLAQRSSDEALALQRRLLGLKPVMTLLDTHIDALWHP